MNNKYITNTLIIYNSRLTQTHDEVDFFNFNLDCLKFYVSRKI